MDSPIFLTIRRSAVESIKGVRQEVVDAISKATGNCLTETDIGMGKKRVVRHGGMLPWSAPLADWSLPAQQGKVRDTYDLGDKVIIVTTDRQSAFDRLLASVPFKGQV